MTKRKIVYVLGADFSGTTLLDLMLGSSPDAASVGELAAFVQPTAPGHRNPVCSCHRNCGLWKSGSLNKTAPYENLFEFHKTNTLIDSSKHVPWLISQSKKAKKYNLEISIVLIWKTADDYANSCANRGNPRGWASKWLRYHRAVLQTNLPFYSVSLDHLITDRDKTLRGICKWLSLDFTPEMGEYNKKNHHIVFGSATARQALHREGSEAWDYERKASNRSDFQGNESYSPVAATDNELKAISKIQELLTPDGAKTSNLLPGKNYLLLAMLRKLIERYVYLLGLNPGGMMKRLRSAPASSGIKRRT